MNKANLVDEVAKDLGTKKEALLAVERVMETITKALKKGDTVRLVGFGTFKVVERKAREGRHPQTGEPLKIKAKKVPKFVPGEALKNAVE